MLKNFLLKISKINHIISRLNRALSKHGVDCQKPTLTKLHLNTEIWGPCKHFSHQSTIPSDRPRCLKYEWLWDLLFIDPL